MDCPRCGLKDGTKVTHSCGLTSDMDVITKEYRAVLEKDHRAMEKLRSGKYNFYLQIVGSIPRRWVGEKFEHKEMSVNDPADTILATGE